MTLHWPSRGRPMTLKRAARRRPIQIASAATTGPELVTLPRRVVEQMLTRLYKAERGLCTAQARALASTEVEALMRGER